MGRDCRPAECRCHGCKQQFEAVTTPLLEIKPSTRDTRGFGLFAVEDIGPNTLLGQYTGTIIKDDTKIADHRLRRFAYSKGEIHDPPTSLSLTTEDHSIEPDRRCLIYYINHETEPNARFQVMETRDGRVIRAFTSKVVRAGEEITASYG